MLSQDISTGWADRSNRRYFFFDVGLAAGLVFAADSAFPRSLDLAESWVFGLAAGFGLVVSLDLSVDFDFVALAAGLVEDLSLDADRFDDLSVVLLVLDAALALGIVVLDVERAAGMVRFLRRLKYIAKLPAKISRVPMTKA